MLTPGDALLVVDVQVDFLPGGSLAVPHGDVVIAGLNRCTAVFELFVRKLPPQRNFLVACGLAQVLEFLEQLQFTGPELEWLAGCGRFHARFLESLRFTGDVQAMPEGSIFFADEPIVRVVAPLAQAQLVETRIINLLQFQTLVASKAARVRLAAPNKLLVDFGLRRSHGAEAGLLLARASYVAGFNGSSNVLAAVQWGMPIFGTMAHSYIQAHAQELDAFERFARSHPHSCKVRSILDDGGLQGTTIFASGNLDEYKLAELLQAGARIDGFGEGTRVNTRADQPYLDCAYKLQEYAGVARRKHSEGKATWPGRKQVYRSYSEDGLMAGDVLTTEDAVPGSAPLLMPVMLQGRRLGTAAPLEAVREYARAQLMLLPPALRTLEPAARRYAVTIAPALQALAAQVDQRMGCLARGS